MRDRTQSFIADLPQRRAAGDDRELAIRPGQGPHFREGDKNSRAELLAVYVHWPFCRSKCPYCDFNSHVRDNVD
ncbi:MAG: hypothetical protein J2P48_14395, partial [Alphaproteobacteria bacterium]|nr:hypothetical protein [Alphaproteobacteria bacterium]